jgi:hypothetical protein
MGIRTSSARTVCSRRFPFGTCADTGERWAPAAKGVSGEPGRPCHQHSQSSVERRSVTQTGGGTEPGAKHARNTEPTEKEAPQLEPNRGVRGPVRSSWLPCSADELGDGCAQRHATIGYSAVVGGVTDLILTRKRFVLQVVSHILTCPNGEEMCTLASPSNNRLQGCQQ